MGNTGAADSLAVRKQAEQRRLAEALRANLARRKAQSRDRRAGSPDESSPQRETAAVEPAQGDAATGHGGATDTGD